MLKKNRLLTDVNSNRAVMHGVYSLFQSTLFAYLTILSFSLENSLLIEISRLVSSNMNVLILLERSVITPDKIRDPADNPGQLK